MLDAIYLGLSEMKKATTNRRALLVISDGGDNHSRYTEKDIKRAVKESDVQIYAVGIFEPLSSRARTPEEAGGPGLLADLAEVSGGPDVQRRGCERTTRHRRKNLHRAEEPVRHRISSLEPDPRWPLAAHQGKTGSPQGTAAAPGIRPHWILCSYTIE